MNDNMDKPSGDKKAQSDAESGRPVPPLCVNPNCAKPVGEGMAVCPYCGTVLR